ncbi:hypothetical protein C4553_01775 [Candidatus Parcubacteria bacterium]|nr:MAG: hypothetical protein C4553_01775 [Candidatus Parcubacteria bacterium]
MRDSVKVVRAALSEEKKDIILRGEVDPGSLHQLQTAPYQREVLPLAKINTLIEAFQKSTVPDIELGMRGGDFMERDGAFYLKNDVFIIDGLQRVTAAMRLMQLGTGKSPRLGCTVHFNTTEEWERDRFRILNTERTKLSPNILLRNLQHEFPVVSHLFSLTTRDRGFVMHGKISWSQRMKHGELITALTFCKAVGALHSHLGPGRGSKTDELARGLQKIMEVTGPNVLRENARTFSDILDQCWGIRIVTIREGAAYLRNTFLICLATLFSRHQDFWRDKRFFVERDLIRKIKLFPVTDPYIVNLASASGKAREILYQMLLNHVNSGKRTRRLRPNETAPPLDLSETPEETMDQAAAAAGAN